MSFKFQVDKKALAQVEANTRAAFQKVISNKVMLTELSNAVITDIKFQTRKGISIPNKGRLKPLSKKWVETRTKISKAQQTQEAFSPRRSNLSLSGQLLDSMRSVVIGAGKIKIFFEGFHEPYVAKYLDFFTRRKKKSRRVNNRTVKGFETGRGSLIFVNTRKSGTYTIGKPIKNEKLAEYVAENGRPFMGVRDSLKPRLNRIVVAYLRRAARFFS